MSRRIQHGYLSRAPPSKRASRIDSHREAVGIKSTLKENVSSYDVHCGFNLDRRARKFRTREIPSEFPSLRDASWRFARRRKYLKTNQAALGFLSRFTPTFLTQECIFYAARCEGSAYFCPRRNSDRWFFILASPSELQELEKCRYITFPTAASCVDYFWPVKCIAFYLSLFLAFGKALTFRRIFPKTLRIS